MTSIIPLPGAAPSDVNVTNTMDIRGPTTVATGESLYTTSLPAQTFQTAPYTGGRVLIHGGSPTADLVNYGTIWCQLGDPNTVGYRSYLVSTQAGVENHGLAVLDVNVGLAYGFLIDGDTFNDGSLLVYSDHDGSAFGVVTVNQYCTVTNGGLIGTYAGTGGAYGVRFDYGGTLHNLASGSILAEGAEACGVVFWRGDSNIDDTTPEIINEGLIKASSLDPQQASVGIYLLHYDFEVIRIDNSGTISGDYAIYSNADVYSQPMKSVDIVTNKSTGRIKGDIFLDLGDDIVINRGSIVGDVLLGDGNDQFDTRYGTCSGLTDLGFGDDVFLGSAGKDVVRGDGGNDLIKGYAGQDLLLGDGGNDTLVGGMGNDGLYGEFGNDLIFTQDGDFVLAGSGDDRVQLGNYAFEYISGGSGTDVLVLPDTGKILDLSAVLASGRIVQFDRVVLPGAQEIVIRAADIVTLTGGAHELSVLAGSSGTISLVGAWTETGQKSIDGVLYRSFSLSGETVLAQSGAVVSVLDAPPLDATGLDPIQPGPLAPLPGSVPGTGLLTGGILANNYEYLDPLVIGSDEIWYSSNGVNVLGCWSLASLTNDGAILSFSEHLPLAAPLGIRYLQNWLPGATGFSSSFRGAEAIGVTNSGFIINNGLVSATSFGEGQALSVFVGAFGPIFNLGRIEAHAESVATGIFTYDSGLYYPSVRNEGVLFVESTGSLALGVVFANKSALNNSGIMDIQGAGGAIAISTWGSLEVVNSGSIIATTTAEGGAPSVAFHLYANDSVHISNTGTIQADVLLDTYGIATYGLFLVDNSGLLEGDMFFLDGRDRVTNAGTIAGDVHLGGSKDTYDGSAGQLLGSVYGEGGDDILIGGDGGNILLGGDGNDFLESGFADDTLDGGLGNDTVSYARSTVAVIVNLSKNAEQETGGAGIDTLIGFENLIGSSFNDTLTGTDGANVLNGGLGNDVLIGRAGIDTASYEGAVAGVVVNLSQSKAQDTVGAGIDTLRGIENLIGSAFNDKLTGDAGPNLLEGGKGNDVLDGGAGIDTASYQGATSRVVVSLAVSTPQNTLAGSDTLRNIENLIGSQFNDKLTGDDGCNILNGGLGNDVLDGGGGIDTVSYEGALTGVTVNLALTTAQKTFGAGMDLLTNKENVIGSVFNDRLIGNSGNNVLTGGAGMDKLAGNGGDDIFDFNSLSEMKVDVNNRDVITDFGSGDKIDLSTLDANFLTATNDAFDSVFVSQFTAPGQLMFSDGVLYGNTDADAMAEFAIGLPGVSALYASDIIL